MNKEFWSRIKKFSEALSHEDEVYVVSHHDADGITACAIMVDLMRSLGKETDYRILKQLDSTSISEVSEISVPIVFTDMGSGQLSLLSENGISGFYVVDHHPPEYDYEMQVNPNLYGYDGGKDISGSGMAYLVAKALGHEDMAHIAIVGAVGDMQDSRGSLCSLNRVILSDAQRNGTLKVSNDLRLFGRQSRPISQMLSYASDPFLPGLTGREEDCRSFLQQLDISLMDGDRLRSYVDLSFPERQKLTSALYMRLLDSGVPEFVVQGMIGEVYTLLGEEKGTELRDSKEFSTVLNACGRQQKPSLGVEVCLGDRGDNWLNAKSMLQQHRRMLREGIEYLKAVGTQSMETFDFFDAQGAIKESIIGIVAGMAYGARILDPGKPVLAFAEDKDNPGYLKVSSRANWGLVRSGIHLGQAMRECSKAVGGDGGGHNIAAGAKIPLDKRDTFLQAVDSMFSDQLNA